MALVLPGSQSIPCAFAKSNLSSLQENFDFIRDYFADEWTQGLFVSGPTGVGKSWALAALTRAISEAALRADQPLDFCFIAASEMFDRTSTFGDGSDSHVDTRYAKPYRATFLHVPWLVIDDLGGEYRGGQLADQVQNKLRRLLQHRTNAGHVTHITTQLAAHEVRGLYSNTCWSLIEQSMQVHSARGEDMRKKFPPHVPSWRRQHAARRTA